MTVILRLPEIARAERRIEAPEALHPSEVSVVVPVKDNQTGINRLIAALSMIAPSEMPGEVVLVDNLSKVPLAVPSTVQLPIPVHLVTCSTPGPAAARNIGAGQAKGKWILFIDSDCIPTRTTTTGFGSAMNGSIAYAGEVKAIGTDRLSRYYDTQKTLVPPPIGDRPAYLVTANTLVWRNALEAVGGFDERFPFAGGEDIDLALRLRAIGELSYAPEAVVLHDFDDGLAGFLRRFVRYGAGNRMIGMLHGHDMTPRAFWPERATPFNIMAAVGQLLAMKWGYWRAFSETST